MKKAVLVIAKEMFRDEEYIEPKSVLEKNGIYVTTASSVIGRCTGRFGATADSQMTVGEIDPSKFDAIVFIGGPGSYDFHHDKKCHEILKKSVELGKVIAGICAAAATLAFAGVLKGKTATSFSGVGKDLAANGANYTGKGVEVDGKIITADGPQSAKLFGEEIVKVLNR
jgi:protease I